MPFAVTWITVYPNATWLEETDQRFGEADILDGARSARIEVDDNVANQTVEGNPM